MTDTTTDTTIRQTVADAEEHQSDVDPFVALHTEDAIIVNIAGRRVLGGDAIRAAMTQAMATPLGQVRTRQEIVDIRYPTPDVAIVSCVKHVENLRDDKGTPLPVTGALTYLLVHDHDRWRIALAQTTPV